MFDFKADGIGGLRRRDSLAWLPKVDACIGHPGQAVRLHDAIALLRGELPGFFGKGGGFFPLPQSFRCIGEYIEDSDNEIRLPKFTHESICLPPIDEARLQFQGVVVHACKAPIGFSQA